MFTVVITEKGGAQRKMEFDKNEVTIGRVQGNDIILPKGNVSKRHSRIVLKDSRFIVVDLKSTNGTYVNGRKITSPLVVKSGDKIYIGDFILSIDEAIADAMNVDSVPPSEAPQPRRSPSAPPPLRSSGARGPTPPPLPPPDEAQPPLSEPVDRFALDQEPAPEMPAPRPAQRPRARTMDRPMDRSTERPPEPAPQRIEMPRATGSARRTAGGGPPSLVDVDVGLRSLMSRLAGAFDVANSDPAALADQARWTEAQTAIEGALGEMEGEGGLKGIDRDQLAGAALREAVGLGALEGLLQDSSVQEIVVEGPGRIVADFGQGFEPVSGGFSSAEALAVVARRLIAQGAGEESSLIQEVTLPYGPHVTVVFPPVAPRGPIIEIRRAVPGPSGQDLIARGVLDASMLKVLDSAVKARRNIVVCGAVGSGVTTILGSLAMLTEESERIVTVEEVADLSLAREHVVSLATGGAGSGVTLRSLVRQGGRMRGDRLIIDDVYGAETAEVLTTVAARAGGSMVGLHTGRAPDALEHLQMLAKLGSGGDEETAANLVAGSVQLIVHVVLGDDGARRIQRIAEVVSGRGGMPGMVDLFVYEGTFTATGSTPSWGG